MLCLGRDVTHCAESEHTTLHMCDTPLVVRRERHERIVQRTAPRILTLARDEALQSARHGAPRIPNG